MKVTRISTKNPLPEDYIVTYKEDGRYGFVYYQQQGDHRIKYTGNIFQTEDSEFFFMRVFVKFTNPLLKIFNPLTPPFIIQPLVPLYVAWFFFMIRFYLMPWVLGYSVMGMLSFPLESEISRQIYQFFNSIKF